MFKILAREGYPWNEKATRTAALKGNLECLKYLHENGCPWDEEATLGAYQIFDDHKNYSIIG